MRRAWRHYAVALAFCGGMLGGTGAPRAEGVERSVLVWPVAATAELDEPELLTDYLSNRLQQSGAFQRVIGWKDMQTVIEHDVVRQRCGASDDSCMAELAGALGVRYIARTTIGALGSTTLSNFRLIDAEAAHAVGVCSERSDGSQDALVDAVDRCVPLLVAELPGRTTRSTWLEPTARWGSTAGALALFAAGGAFGALSLSSMDAQADAETAADIERLNDEAQGRAQTATGLLVAGGVVAAGALVLWAFELFAGED